MNTVGLALYPYTVLSAVRGEIAQAYTIYNNVTTVSESRRSKCEKQLMCEKMGQTFKYGLQSVRN